MFGLGKLKLFKIFGIAVQVHWSFLLVLLLFAFMGGAQSVFIGLLIFTSVLVHEFGHSLTARRLGVQVSEIELHFFGGVAKMTTLPRSPKHEILIAAAGPLTSLALAALGGGAWMLSGSMLALELGVVNLTLAVFNMLPALPMDGGRIFRAGLQTRLGGLKATRIATKVARGIAVALAIFGLFYNPFLIMIAVLLWSMAGQELRLAELRYGPYESGEVEVIPPGAYDAQHGGPIPVQALFEELSRRYAQQQGDTSTRRYVIRDSHGRVVVVEEGGYRW